jgi:hypothetical protein
MYLWLNLKKSTFVYLMVDQVTSKIELTDALKVARSRAFLFLTNFLIHRVLTLSPL